MSAIETARDFWGEAMPDWVQALAEACDRESQNKVAARIERSRSLVSTILRNRYPADTRNIEDIVRGHFMAEHVDCPVLGQIGKQICRKWRGKARAFENVNSQHVTMYRACNRCALHKEDDHARTER